MGRPGEPEASQELPRWSQLLSRCSARLAELDILRPDEPFDLEVFRSRLADRRGRPIYMTAIRLPPLRRPHPRDGEPMEETLCGIHFSTELADHVYYTETLSPLHAAHNAVHELAHLIMGHQSTAPLARPSLGGWAAAADSVQEWLAGLRSSYREMDEIEAEAMAAVVLSERVRDGVPRRFVSSSMMRLGSDRLADAWR